jgi:hypothetical protein
VGLQEKLDNANQLASQLRDALYDLDFQREMIDYKSVLQASIYHIEKLIKLENRIRADVSDLESALINLNIALDIHSNVNENLDAEMIHLLDAVKNNITGLMNK